MKKEATIIAGIFVIAIVLAGLVFLTGADTALPTSSEKAVSVRVLSEGTYASGITLKKNYRVTNESQLEQVWALAHGQTVDALPEVDFATEEVLAVFGGERPSGGYSIAVERVTDGAKREVIIVHRAPGSSCMVTDALTSPFQIVLVPKTDKEMDRKDRNVTVACE